MAPGRSASNVELSAKVNSGGSSETAAVEEQTNRGHHIVACIEEVESSPSDRR